MTQSAVDVGWVVVTLFGLILAVTAFSLKRNLHAIDQALARIESMIVGKEVCGMKHREIDRRLDHTDRRLDHHERCITHLYQVGDKDMPVEEAK